MTETKKKIDLRKLEEVLEACARVVRQESRLGHVLPGNFGLGGVVRRTFTTPDQMAEFEHSDACREIQRMLTRLRARPVVRPELKKTEGAELEAAIPGTELREAAEGTGMKEKTKSPQPERTKVITVRLPVSLHEALGEEAHEHRTSVNKLCISKLLQFIDHDFVPTRVGA